MIPAPQGYVDFERAIDTYVRSIFGGWKSDRWHRHIVTADEAGLPSAVASAGTIIERLVDEGGREQRKQAIEWFQQELLSGRLEATAGGRVIPAPFWADSAWALRSISSGFVAPVNDQHAWQGVVDEPLFIEKSAIAASISAARGAPPPARRGRPSDKRATEEQHRAWAAEIDARDNGVTIDAVCRSIARREGIHVDSSTIEREARRYREKRERKIPRNNFPR